MTTALDLVESTRRYLFTGQSEEMNKLSGSISASQIAMPMTYDLSALQRGVILSVDLEEIYVFAVDSTSKQVTDCLRGFNGTTAATHASGAAVVVRPKFSNFAILRALNDDLLDLGSPWNGLYQVKTVDITFNPVRFGYDMTSVTDILSIAEVRYRTPGPTKTWPRIEKYSLARNMPSTGTYGDFASGTALMVYEAAFPGLPIRVRYRAPYNATLAALTDNVTSVTGLQTFAMDIPPIGAAIRLAVSREIKRNFTEAQGEPRRAEEVPPQATMNSVQGLARLRQQRINAAAVVLQRQFSDSLVGA